MYPFPSSRAMVHPDRLGLDRDPALPLEVHLVAGTVDLLRSERVPVELEEPVGQVDFPWSMWAMMEKLRMFSIRMSSAFRKISPCLGSTPA